MSLLPKWLVGALAALVVWGASLAGMTAVRNAPDAVARVFEPSGLLVSRQDMTGRTMFYRELRAAVPARRPGADAADGRC